MIVIGSQAFADAEEAAFAHGIGFHFWSLKMSPNKNSLEWNFEAAVKNGMKL